MCLYTFKKEPEIAKKDIIVYKWLTKNGHGPYYKLKDKKGNLLPFVKGYRYTEIDCVNYYKLIRSEGGYSLTSGVFHSFTTDEKQVRFDGWCTVKCYKMIIPKGTKYWVSKCGKEMASKTLIFPNEDN